MENLVIKKIMRKNYIEAIDLVYQVFLEFEGADYSQEGIDEFYHSIHDLDFLSMLNMDGAYYNDELIGVFASRSNNTHVALFFVKKEYQRQGVGKALFNNFIQEYKPCFVTVNASPYAVNIYERLGFVKTKEEQVIKGIRFTPMKKNIG